MSKNRGENKAISWRRWLHLAGGGLALGGAVFVGIRLSSYLEDIDFSIFTNDIWVGIIFSVLIYGVSNAFLARAWCHLITFFDEGDIQWKWALRVFGCSQLAKYIPGNIFHLAGRQALGMVDGVPAHSLAQSMVWELGLIAVIGSFFGIFALPAWGIEISTQLAVGIFISIFFILCLALEKSLGDRIAYASIWQLCFLLVSGGIFGSMLFLISSLRVDAHLLILFCGGYVVAWLISVITPGAPAGIGVREAVLIFLLKDFVQESELLLTIIVVRLISVIGDLLFFVCCYSIKIRAAGKIES